MGHPDPGLRADDVVDAAVGGRGVWAGDFLVMLYASWATGTRPSFGPSAGVPYPIFVDP